MQNEQCGKCWNLEFDRQGDKTHVDFNNGSHKFVPLDFCVKCQKLKYDQFGLPTHLDAINDFILTKNLRISHKFISAIEIEFQERNEKKRNVFRFIGLGVVSITSMITISNLFF